MSLTEKQEETLKDLYYFARDVVAMWQDYQNGEEVHMWMAIKALDNIIKKIEKDDLFK